MCGITGVWERRVADPDETRRLVEAMRDAIAHRGPDDAGSWVAGPVAFGHRRLSIVDLSELGHQPMTSPDGRFVICYNGEVYNFIALREELQAHGHNFRGGSDTEVMLAAFSEWGVEGAVRRFVGMFAFALWDAHEHAMYLVRDRLGIKPLYVGRSADGDLLFGSELKALMAHPRFNRRVDPGAFASYLRYTYVPSPGCMFADAMKLAPGHWMRLDAPDAPWEPRPYWNVDGAAREGAEHPFAGTTADAEGALDGLLRDAVRLRMIADVPLGAFLSGGIDSSLVVALMQAQSDRPVKTFTIGFAEQRYDESRYARAIADHLGTAHTELTVTPGEAQALIPTLPVMYDEPLADVSQIPTHIVAALARRHVTVALSGDGGDELFGGYDRYRFSDRIWRRLRRMPLGLRQGNAALLRAMARGVAGVSGSRSAQISKAADLLGMPSLQALYRRLVSTAGAPENLINPRLRAEADDPLSDVLGHASGLAPMERMMLADASVYLPDDLLTKFDRASMMVGLEGRVPLLDHRVAEFAWSLPLAWRTGAHDGKILLRRVLARYVPATLFERPKMGFEVPIGGWLRGPLRAWADDLLDPAALRDAGFFEAGQVRRIWQAHAAGRADGGHLLWSVLMFEAWRRQWGATG
jgi:asparagine synthase (glutamine-hydrolysing)